MKIKKLDRRMNGFGKFEYKVEYSRYNEHRKFVDARNWCWDQWGPSCELEFWNSNINPAWCWIVDNRQIKILLASTKETQWFSLKWS